MPNRLIPTEQEITIWMIATLQHVLHIEFFFNELKIGQKDPERPHDLVGQGNKFEWEVMRGFALQYRNPMPEFKKDLEHSLLLHRQQYHHRKWNGPDPDNFTKPAPGVTQDDMLVGAVDSVCALLENRGYQGGSHNYDEIMEIARNNPHHKAGVMLSIIPLMRSLRQPEMGKINSLSHLPNIGVPVHIYNAILERTNCTINQLRCERGYSFPNFFQNQ